MNKRKITMKLFSLKKLLSNKKTSLLLLFLLLISGALFAKSSINQNKNLDNYKNYYLKGIFSVESEPSIDGEQKYNRYFVIYDNKIFTTLNDIYTDDNKKIKDGKYNLKTYLGTRIDIVVKNGNIEELKPLKEDDMKKEMFMKESNCLTADFLYRFYLLYLQKKEGYVNFEDEWFDKRTKIYAIVNEDYFSYGLYILDNKTAIFWDREIGGYEDEWYIEMYNNQNNDDRIDCFTKIDSTHLKLEKDSTKNCYIKLKNCKIIN